MQLAVGHANPDFDAYAATVAATKLFPGTKGVYLGSQNDNVREFHNLHEGLLDFVDLKGLDLDAVTRLVMVDTRDPGRIGELGEVALSPDVEVVVFDHHPPAEGDLTGVDDRSLEVGATTSILVHELRRQGVTLTPLEASVMLLGIHEDTGSLTYPGTTAYDADAAAYLMSVGAEMDVLDRFLLRTLTPPQRTLLDRLLSSLDVADVHGQEIAIGVAEMDVYVDSASVVTHYLVEDLGYKVAFAVVSMPERLHVVGRSRLAEVDVAAVLKHLGGGGHAQAASAAIRDGDVGKALASLREALEAEVGPPLVARDIWSSPVRTVSPATTMEEAGQVMSRWGHGGLPVVDRSRLVGLVTRKDVDKAARHDLAHAPVKGFMARDIVTVGPETDLPALERLLACAGIGRVPVVENGELVGIVTRKDVLRAEHGEDYLDRRVPQGRAQSSERFLASFGSLLPEEAQSAIRMLGELAEERGLRAHVVGGFVRDMLIGRRNLDIDVVVEGDGVGFAEAAAEVLGGRVKIHRRFGTAVLVLSRELHIDVTSARTEYYARPGALPTVERSSLRQDLFRRDFSVNAMAVCIDPDCFGALADPFGGLRDLESGVIRVLHSMSFVEDPTRVLRSARFASRYGFSLDPTTEELARQAVRLGMLDEVSGARIREETLDLIDEDPATPAFKRLAKLDALPQVLPEERDGEEFVRDFSATERAYKRLAPLAARTPRRRVTLVTPFVAGIGRVAAERWLRRMRFGREYVEPSLAVADHGTRLARALKDRRGMRDSRLHAMLTTLPTEATIFLWATGDRLVRERVERYLRELSHVRAAVTGSDLIALGYEPSPAFSAILAQALADRLDGRAVGREQELANLRRLATRAGLDATPA